MNRRNFFKSATKSAVISAISFPMIAKALTPVEKVEQVYPDSTKISHHYPGSYYTPNDLFTPEEITEAGFVFVPYPSFIHQHNDPWHPIMQSYVGYGNNLDPSDKNYQPLVAKSSMYGPSYTKTYDWDSPRRRGIESLPDYFRKKDIFKPMILEFMRKKEFHYVHRVLLGDSPSFWRQRMGKDKEESDFYLYPVFVRGSRLPPKRS